MKILLVDDHDLFVEGLQNLLRAGGYEVAGTASDGLEGLERARRLRPDLILMDIRMPGCSGLEALRRIKAEMPEIRIVMLTTSAEDADLFEALKSGASGYLLKNLKPNQLFNYLTGLERGEAPLSRELSACLLREFSHQAQELEASRQAQREEWMAPEMGAAGAEGPGEAASGGEHPGAELSGRQREILELVAGGLSYKEAGAALCISENTVKYHMGEIIQRLHVKNREQVVVYALQAGIVQNGGNKASP